MNRQKNTRTTSTLLLPILLSMNLNACSTAGKGLPEPEEIREIILRVNDHWQSTHRKPGNAFWHNAVYQTGNMAAYRVTGVDRYLEYSLAWAERNRWKGARSDRPENWKYRYGETQDYVLFGDWQACFQTYIDLFLLNGDSTRIARALEVMEYQMGTGRSDYWWWVDGLYMVMPVMTKLYGVTGDERYLDKLYEYFSYTYGIMFDGEDGLFYRDARYVYPRHQTRNGKKDFWARGNGWAFAALAKILPDLPEDYAHRDFFIGIFRKMAAALKESQHEEGYWSRSILDPGQAPGPESSGTAFMTFGLLRGINMGLLATEEYQPVVRDAWNFLVNVAVDGEGRLGFVQPIGDRAVPGQVVDENSTADFGVGAFLLAASELYCLVNH